MINCTNYFTCREKFLSKKTYFSGYWNPKRVPQFNKAVGALLNLFISNSASPNVSLQTADNVFRGSVWPEDYVFENTCT